MKKIVKIDKKNGNMKGFNDFKEHAAKVTNGVSKY